MIWTMLVKRICPNGTRSRGIAILVTVALTLAVLGTCVPAASPAGASAPPLAATRSAFSLSVSAVIADLAAEGVGVYASPSAQTPLHTIAKPVVKFRILKSQAVIDAA